MDLHIIRSVRGNRHMVDILTNRIALSVPALVVIFMASAIAVALMVPN